MHKPLIALYVLVSLLASPAHADWTEASSDHFVVYGDLGAKAIGSFADRLEFYDAAMTHVLKTTPTKPSPSNRVTVYVVSDQALARRIEGDQSAMAGFLPAAGATVALVPLLAGGPALDDARPDANVFHGYAHEFLFSLTSRAFPRWFVEGFAQFFSGVKYLPGGSINLGVAAPPRSSELPHTPIRKLLEYAGGANDAASFEALYQQSRLLFHYLYLAPERAGQLARYQAMVTRGEPALRAAEIAFGDFDQLERDANQFSKHLRFAYLEVGRKFAAVAPVAVRKLRPGEAAMMPLIVQSRTGPNREDALAFVPTARSVAALHRDDPAVLAALASIEFAAGNDDATIAAADAATALDPTRVDAQIQKGYALYRKAEHGVLPQDSWKDVRGQFARANKLENDNPIALVRFYMTYRAQNQTPPQNAVEGLELALALSPLDPSLRLSVAQQLIADNRLADAAATLTPLAYSPHPDDHAASALQMLRDVEAKMANPKVAATE